VSVCLPSVIMSHSICILESYPRVSLFVWLQYYSVQWWWTRPTNEEIEKVYIYIYKERKENSSFSSFVHGCACVVELLQQLGGVLLLLLLRLRLRLSSFSTLNLSASLLVFCVRWRPIWMHDQVRASKRAQPRREESARVSHAIIYRMMMNIRQAGK